MCKDNAKTDEVAMLQEKVDAAKHDSHKLAYWEKEIDAPETLMEQESDNPTQYIIYSID